jgi:hypothetical protein
LHGVLGLSTDHRQAVLDGRLDLPEIGGLTDEQAAVTQAREEVGVVAPKVGEDILVRA